MKSILAEQSNFPQPEALLSREGIRPISLPSVDIMSKFFTDINKERIERINNPLNY
jgi:hypothetical protein